MLEFACHSWGFNDLSLTEALGTIARMGFRYVDIGSGTHLNVSAIARDPRGAAAKINADLTRYNLKLSDLYLMLPRISLADDEKREKDIETYRALLPFIVALEADGVTLSPGLVHSGDDDGAFTRTVESLKTMMEASRLATPATRLHVSIEPHMDSMAQKPEQALKLVDAVQDLEITLDWAQMVCQGVPPEDIAKLLPHTRHVQVRQATYGRLQTAFDDGAIIPAEVLDMLDDHAYEGRLSIEYMKTRSLRHGMVEVDSLVESTRLRDAFRQARDGE